MNNSKSFVDRMCPLGRIKRRLGKRKGSQICQAQDRVEAIFDACAAPRCEAGAICAGSFSLRVKFHFRANVARRRDDFLQQRNLLLGRGVDAFGMRLRKTIERD